VQSTEEYKIFLDHVNGLATRRQSVSTTYLSVNTVISAAMAFLFRDGQLSGWIEQVSVLALLVAGFVASSLWRRLIRQYSLLIGWWYEQLRALENTMSAGSKAITKEYDRWYLKEQDKAAIGLTRYETGLTWLFTAMYALFSLGILAALISQLR
jgi:hypothetical protein